MNIREQLSILIAKGAEFVVVGGQAGVLRQAIEFSHDLDIIIRATPENAARVRDAVREIAHVDADPSLLLGRDFQQYVDEATGTEIDVHLTLIAIPDYASALLSSSSVDFNGLPVPVLELPALYAAKRTDRPRDAIHRRAIEDRLRFLLLRGQIEVDEVILAICLDDEVRQQPQTTALLPELASTSAQALLQVRLIALGIHMERLTGNRHLDPAAKSLLELDATSREKLVSHPSRLAALLARIPLTLPASGYRVRKRADA